MGATVLQFKPKGGGMALDDLTISEIEETYRRRKRDLRERLKELEEQRRYLVERHRGKVEELGPGLEVFLMGLTPATKKAYVGELKRADAYFKGQPIDDDNLPEYLLFRHEELNHAPASILLGVRALSWRADKLDEPDPFGKKSQSVMSHIKREGKEQGRGRGKVDPILKDDLDEIVDCCEEERTLLGLRDACMISLGFDAALRVSEISAVQAEQVATGRDGKVRLFIPVSKTDQSGQGVYIRISEYTGELIKLWRLRSGISAGPLFRPVRAEGIRETALTDHAIRNAVRKRAKQAGIRGRISGHSLRRGCSQSMTLEGIPAQAVAVHCRWKSTAMVVRYAEGAEVADSAIGMLYGED